MEFERYWVEFISNYDSIPIKYKERLESEINRLFYEEVYNIGQICFAILPELGKYLKGKYPQKVFSEYIRIVCNIKDWDEWARVRNNLRQKKKRYSSGASKARKLALERDGYKCVLTGATENLEVHHIDRDPKNDELWNLMTVTKEIHKLDTHGAKGWRNIWFQFDFLEYIQERGFKDAYIRVVEGNYERKYRLKHELTNRQEFVSFLQSKYGSEYKKELESISDEAEDKEEPDSTPCCSNCLWLANEDCTDPKGSECICDNWHEEIFSDEDDDCDEYWEDIFPPTGRINPGTFYQ